MILHVITKITDKGFYLSAKTAKGDYGQCYNTVDPLACNYVKNLPEAKTRFLHFYNRFE